MRRDGFGVAVSVTSTGLKAVAVAACLAACTAQDSLNKPSSEGDPLRIAIIADSHVIDSYYTCCEGSTLDTESLQFSADRLVEVGQQLNALEPPPDALFVAGDVVHEFPSSELSFYEENITSMDIVKSIFDAFDFPVHLGMGNHDYELGVLSREQTWELVERKWKLPQTYYTVEYDDFKFIVLDGQRGPTWDDESDRFDPTFASFGAEQLVWLEAELSEGKPSFLFFHHPPNLILRDETDGLIPHFFDLIDDYGETIQAVFTGHMHMWLDSSMILDSSATSHRDSAIKGFGLAATRYDRRNWWVLEIDRATGSWEIPRQSETVLASYFYDGVAPEGL